jgi:hypothetical protein
LRDYQVPHLRRGGRISIPEDSFDRIREARDLHREGLGTESVRRRLDERDAGIAERLDGISDALEDLRENLGPPHGMSSHEALRTILARQTVLISAVSELTGMVEELVSANEHPRRKRSGIHPLQGARVVALPAPQGDGRPPQAERPVERVGKFGARRRRRRWGIVAGAVGALLLGGLAYFGSASVLNAPPEGARGTGPEATRAPRGAPEEARSGGVREGAAGGDAARASTTARVRSSVAVPVPDVSGLEAGAAARRLREEGFRVPGFRTANGPAGEVLGTEPRAGASAGDGARVILVIGDGSAEG